jgi:LacI family transcriptional regulator, repressor for deo operon, udp, cdd, tsx, nupC, and nupG
MGGLQKEVSMSNEELQATASIRPARIKDVAARAGVSLKTVSNVVHQRPYVRAETRDRVRRVIEELDYRPSLAGRQLQSGRSNMVALAVPRIDEPYLSALAHAIIAAATPRGYTVLIDETGGTADHEEQAASGYRGHGMDGVIFSPIVSNPELLATKSLATPMVLLGEPLPESTADYVAIDNVRSARDVVQHLLQGGRRRFGYLGCQPDRPTGVGSLRFQGFIEELSRAQLPVMEQLILPGGSFNREEGEQQVERLLARRHTQFDALVCASDLLAFGAMRALRAHGIEVPQEVAVVGWDNTIDAAYHTPSLTSVAPDLGFLAERTLEALLDRIDGNRTLGVSITVPHQLVIRDSSRSKLMG